MTATLCRTRLAMWQALLCAATARPPLDKALREVVVQHCEDSIRMWERRLVRAERLEAA